MNVILFEEHELVPQGESFGLRLRDHRAHHAIKILKPTVGETLRVGQIGGRTGTATVEALDDDEIRLQIIELNTEPPEPSRIELILALPRPKSLKRTLRAIANLGIKSIHLINSVKVDKSYWGAPALEPLTMRQSLLDGLAIARDTAMPQVRLHKLFKPFAQDVAPHLIESEGYVAHPARTTSHLEPARPGSRIPVAIGPEGGFTDYEVKLFNEAGFKNLSLGERLYSVETAVPVIESFFRFR